MRVLTKTIWLAGFILAGSFGSAALAEDGLTPRELELIKAAEAARIQAIESVYGAVVAIYGNNRQGGGSGVLYDESGLALTNHHVVAAAGPEGWAGLADGRLYRWKLIGTDPGGDVAIIQLTGKPKFPTAAIGDSDDVHVGDWAMAMGNPFVLAEDQKPTVTLGIISGVNRYQGGSGVNQLVYGNCIQIDSSINPGNSGGPLFNMRGEIIGINGRGSFKERGRVNVGLGYAISSNQIKNFIPDLLATKVAQHGTFDAVFGDRQAGVVCETINLDARISELGLKLGDRVVSLEGHAISTANQFTNIITTLPADWPTQLVYERGGTQATVWMRLIPLPYQTHRHEDQPEPKKEEEDEDKPKPPQPTPRGPKIRIDNPGEIRDKELNSQNAKRTTQRWREFVLSPNRSDAPVVYVLQESIVNQGQTIGTQTTHLAGDGRFRTSVTRDGLTYDYVFDGEKYWSMLEGEEAKEISRSRALLNSDVYGVVGLASAFRTEPLSQLGDVILDGGDKSQGQIAYRIKTVDDEGDWFYVWLSVFGTAGGQEVRLRKAGPDADCDRAAGGITYSDWRSVEGARLPFQRNLVRGLSESVELNYTTESCESVQLDAAYFKVVKGEASNAE